MIERQAMLDASNDASLVVGISARMYPRLLVSHPRRSFFTRKCHDPCVARAEFGVLFFILVFLVHGCVRLHMLVLDYFLPTRTNH